MKISTGYYPRPLTFITCMYVTTCFGVFVFNTNVYNDQNMTISNEKSEERE